MTARRFVDKNGRIPIGLVDWIAASPTDEIAGESTDPSCEDEFDAVDNLELIYAFGADALIELIRARLEEDDDADDWDDVGAVAVAGNRASRSVN